VILGHDLDRLLPVARLQDMITLLLKHPPDHLTRVGVVIYYQYYRLRFVAHPIDGENCLQTFSSPVVGIAARLCRFVWRSNLAAGEATTTSAKGQREHRQKTVARL
jgi:hypothetical protein